MRNLQSAAPLSICSRASRIERSMARSAPTSSKEKRIECFFFEKKRNQQHQKKRRKNPLLFHHAREQNKNSESL